MGPTHILMFLHVMFSLFGGFTYSYDYLNMLSFLCRFDLNPEGCSQSFGHRM